MLRVSILDEEVVHSLGDLGGSVKPSDHHHERVSLALLELGDVANVEGLVRSLALNEDVVTNFVLDIVVIASVSDVFPLVIFPGFAK